MRRLGVPILVTSVQLMATPAGASPTPAPGTIPHQAGATKTPPMMNLARPIGRPLNVQALTKTAPAPREQHGPLHNVATKTAPPQQHTTPIDQPKTTAKVARPIKLIEQDIADHGAEVARHGAEVERLRPSLNNAGAKLATARAAAEKVRAELKEAGDGPGFFANLLTFGGASRRHYERTLSLRDKLQAADAELAKAEHAFKVVQGRFNAAEARWKESQTAHTAAKTELADLRNAEVAELKSQERAESAAKHNQYLAHLLKSGAGTEGYRRAALRSRAASFVVEKPREGGVTEDAVAMNPEKGLYAISDGVTNAVDSGPLARLLVRKWATEPPKSTGEMTSTWLKGVQEDWSKETSGLKGRNLWFNANARGDATFVGAQVIDGPRGPRLKVMGIGDSMIFVVRKGKLTKTFPLERSDQFSNLVQTFPSRGKADFPALEATWDVKPEDEVFMTTDALGKWVFTEIESGRNPFPALRTVKSQDAWTKFVAAAREQPQGAPMDVDDTALVRFVIPKD